MENNHVPCGLWYCGLLWMVCGWPVLWPMVLGNGAHWSGSPQAAVGIHDVEAGRMTYLLDIHCSHLI
jgi:hypothetical protein